MSVEALAEWVRTLGAAGSFVFGLAALIEYVFPPFPGDVITVLSGAWAARSGQSLWLLQLALDAGSVVGMWATWRLGRALEARLAQAPDGGRVLGLPLAEVRRAQDLMRRRGLWVLVANRFLPSFRAVVFVAAGASGVPWRRALGAGLVSAVAFNALLVTVGAEVGDNAEQIAAFLSRFRTGSLVVTGVLGALVAAGFLWRRARAQSRP